jgi:hypothetical protein
VPAALRQGLTQVNLRKKLAAQTAVKELKTLALDANALIH